MASRKSSQSARSFKVTPPQLPAILKRRHIFPHLDQARQRPITWIMGPPGAGKTTLVASYLRERKLPTLWYQLDEGDEDIASFFHYIGLSCKAAFPQLRRPLPHLSIEYRGALATFTRRFFEEVYRRCKMDSVLVFDNCQEVPTDSQLYDVLEVALGEMPEGITCICLSRELPPPAFAQLQARQALRIFDPDQLRVTSEEVTALVRLRSQRRRTPSAAFTAKMHEKSSGWFAGLVLLLEHATGDPAMETTSCDDTPQVLFDYLAQEEMRKLTEDTQQFLTKTSFLPVMTEETAAQLTGMRTAGRLLNRLYHTRHFTERRFESEPVYQYHPLFRDFLLARAAQVLPASEVKNLQLRAARLLEESNRVEAAIDLLSAAGEPSELVRLILTHAPTLFAQGRIQTLQAWLAKVPPPIIERIPWAMFWLGICIVMVKHAEGQRLLTQAFDEFSVQEDRVGQLTACCAMVESIMSTWVNTADLDTWTGRLKTLVFTTNSFPSAALEARATFALFMAQQWRDPNVTTMRVVTEMAERMLDRDIDLTQAMFLGVHLVSYKCWMGEWEAAESVLHKLNRLHASKKPSPLGTIWLHTAQSSYDFSVAQIERCLMAVDEGLRLGRRHGLEATALIISTNGALAALSAGKTELAEAYANAIVDRRDLVGLYHHIAGWAAALRNDLHTAVHHMEEAVQNSLNCVFPEAFNRIPLAQVLHELGRHDEAMPHLLRAKQLVTMTGSLTLEWSYELVEAHIAYDRGTEEKAFQHLRKAMTIGRQKQMVNWLWWRPTIMARLYAKALEAGIEPEYVRHVIKKRGLRPDASMKHCAAWPWPVVIRTFGSFEVRLHEEPLRFSRKAQQRPLDLLKALIAFGGRNVPEATLTDALWPEADGDAGHQAFATTLHRLRKLIGSDNLELKGGLLTLAEHACFVDVWAFEQLLEQEDFVLRDGQPAAAQRCREQTLHIYRGSFLTDDTAAWAELPRQRLREKFARMVLRARKELEVGNHPEKARAWVQRGLELDLTREELHISTARAG